MKTPGGTPTSCAMAASSRHVTLHTSEGFRMAVLPAASAGATFHCALTKGTIQNALVCLSARCSTPLLPEQIERTDTIDSFNETNIRNCLIRGCYHSAMHNPIT